MGNSAKPQTTMSLAEEADAKAIADAKAKEKREKETDQKVPELAAKAFKVVRAIILASPEKKQYNVRVQTCGGPRYDPRTITIDGLENASVCQELASILDKNGYTMMWSTESYGISVVVIRKDK